MQDQVGIKSDAKIANTDAVFLSMKPSYTQLVVAWVGSNPPHLDTAEYFISSEMQSWLFQQRLQKVMGVLWWGATFIPSQHKSSAKKPNQQDKQSKNPNPN